MAKVPFNESHLASPAGIGPAYWGCTALVIPQPVLGQSGGRKSRTGQSSRRASPVFCRTGIRQSFISAFEASGRNKLQPDHRLNTMVGIELDGSGGEE
jgi:hypothetical protein